MSTVILAVGGVLGGSAGGALLASPSFAQTEKEWKIMERRLEILENKVAVLDAAAAINAEQTNEITGTDALLRLARLEELLRENSGVLETFSYRLQQAQQNSTAFQNDVDLRFQTVEEQFAALDATDSDSETAAESVVSDALLRLAQLEDLLIENSEILETLSVRLQQVQQDRSAIQENIEQRFQALEEQLVTLETTVRDPGVSAATPNPEIPPATTVSSLTASPSTDSQEIPGLIPELADETTSRLTDNSATDLVGALSKKTTGESAEETNTSLLEINPFPNFGINRDPDSEVLTEPVFESTSNSDANEALAGESVVETNPELEPRPLGVLTVRALPETQETAVSDSQSDDPAAIFAASQALMQKLEFRNDTGLQDEAIQGFRDFLAAYPDHEKASEAHYLIGEIFYALRNEPRSAAEAFVKASQTDRDSPKYLLKLGVTLRQLEQLEKACETFDELLFSGNFPDLTNSARRLANWERQLANC